MEKAQRASRILIAIGLANVLNAFLAGCIQAEKSYHTEHFTNTHWITIISLFAGIASTLCPSFTFLTTAFILAITVDIFALAICSATVIADFFNIIAICKDFDALSTNAFLTRIQVYGMLSYSIMDMLLSGASVALILLILSSCHRSIVDVQVERDSALLSAIGCALIATSMLKFFAWTAELYFLRSIGNIIRYSFMHYTIDEPLWIALNVALGILCILRVPANSPTRIITFCLSALSIYPTVTYLWVDYRWFSNAVVSKAAFAKWTPDWLSILNLSTGAVHILLLIVLTLILISSSTQPLQTNFSPQFKMFLFISGIVAGIISVAVFAFDILTTRLEAFYKIFHGNEQKTPFLTVLCSAFLFLCSGTEVNVFVIPALLTTVLFCLQSTTFLLIAYLYLSWNGYYAEEICELFYRGSARCTDYLTLSGAISHFIETLLHFIIFVSSCIFAYILWRAIQLNSRHGAYNVNAKSIAAVKLEKTIEKIGIVLLIAGAIVIAATVQEFLWNLPRHPLIVLLTSLYHISLAITLIIFPIYQIVVSRNLYANSLHCICLIMISAVRFVDILIQLDYRNIGEVTSWSWRIHNAAEVIALGAHFATIVLCLKVLDIINDTTVPHVPQPFIEFRNPLSTEQITVQQQYAYTFQNAE